ncbi:hypothetical protein [Streptomyces griseus]|uniref:hypothetical protein n=1 Tax=Streptomyces griseus TaxID=1911 RepID=UPI0008403532|nr:hypothetical protein [Streptomyces griseus]
MGAAEQTDIVTIGVGGMRLKCLQLGAIPRQTCQEYYTNPPEGEESIQDRVGRVQDEYIQMLATMHEAAPSAQVITVGYPAVLPEEGSTCNLPVLTELGSIKHTDVDWLRENALQPLNSTIQRAT